MEVRQNLTRSTFTRWETGDYPRVFGPWQVYIGSGEMSWSGQQIEINQIHGGNITEAGEGSGKPADGIIVRSGEL